MMLSRLTPPAAKGLTRYPVWAGSLIVVLLLGCYTAGPSSSDRSSEQVPEDANGVPLAPSVPGESTTTVPGVPAATSVTPLPAQAWNGIALMPQNANSMCVDGVVAAGPSVTLQPCAGTVLQRFKLDEGSLVLAGNRCLSLASAAALNTNVVLQPCDANNTNQLWSYSNGTVYPEMAGRTTPPSLCLSTEAQSTASAATLLLAACTGATAAIPWQFMARDGNNQLAGFTITSKVSASICLDDYGGSSANGTPIRQNTCNANPLQTFITSAGNIMDNYVCMTVGTAASAGGTYVELDACQAGNSMQDWTLEHGQIRVTSGTYAGHCLDLIGNIASVGAQIDVIPCTAASTLATTPQVHWVLGAETLP